MRLSGSICALATPFDSTGTLDFDAFARLLDDQLASGTQALLVAGSTGETHMLESKEWERLLVFAVQHVAGRVPVLAGTGEAGTAKTVRLTQQAAELGADAALVVTPFYVRPTQEGLRRHYLAIADQGGLPLVLYNVPGRTGCDLQPDTVAGVRDHPRIIGLKEARGDHERIHAIAALAKEGFVVLSGDDGSAHEAMLAGFDGVISVVNNLVPRVFRTLCDAALTGDAPKVAELHAALEPLIEALNCAPNPIPVKAGLAELGLTGATLRLPMVELEPGPERNRLRDILQTLRSLPDHP